jgi:hypothetical protein
LSEIGLDDSGERALREAENVCWRSNVAIIAPEHLLGGALLVLVAAGELESPSAEQVAAAIEAAQGTGSESLQSNVMFGSAARAALNFTAMAVRNGGSSIIDARAIAAGTIASGEVNPMFFASLGTTRAALLEALGVRVE